MEIICGAPAEVKSCTLESAFTNATNAHQCTLVSQKQGRPTPKRRTLKRTKPTNAHSSAPMHISVRRNWRRPADVLQAMAFSLVGSSERIEAACHRSRTTRALLTVLCSLIDRRQRYRPIYAGRDWLCQTAQISDRSLTTAISRLVDAGIISSRQILRDAQGRFSRLCITFSSEAIFSFFPDAMVADGEPQKCSPIHEVSKAVEAPSFNSISNKDTGCADDSEKDVPPERTPVAAQSPSINVTHRQDGSSSTFRVPRSLIPLLRAGVTVPGLFSLMSFARDRHQRLEDVVNAIAPKLQGGLIKFPYAYVKRCLFVDRDYARVGAQVEIRTAAKIRRDRRVERFGELNGRVLLAEDGARWNVDGLFLYREPRAGSREAPASLYANADVVKRILEAIDSGSWATL